MRMINSNYIRAALLVFVAAVVVVTADARPADRRGDSDTTRREVRRFDRYLDRHPEVAEDLKREPALVNNPDYLAKHPGLGNFLRQHPGVREELKENPRAFMNRERRYDRRERRRRRNQ